MSIIVNLQNNRTVFQISIGFKGFDLTLLHNLYVSLVSLHIFLKNRQINNKIKSTQKTKKMACSFHRKGGD